MLKLGKISAGHGRALLGGRCSKASKFWQKIIKEGLSVRQIEELVVSLSQSKSISSPIETKNSKEAGVLEVENFLSDKLNTKVSVVTRGGKGRIVVDFADMDDLHRIYNLLNSPQE